LDYLTQQNPRVVWMSAQPITAKGRDVAVIGGGDTGSDCIGTVILQGARRVQPRLCHQPAGDVQLRGHMSAPVQSRMVWATREGRQCAPAVDLYLSGENDLPRL
jgi:NADPH-dependent glutamate synthase beta subunit-like oxidoreductase